MFWIPQFITLVSVLLRLSNVLRIVRSIPRIASGFVATYLATGLVWATYVLSLGDLLIMPIMFEVQITDNALHDPHAENDAMEAYRRTTSMPGWRSNYHIPAGGGRPAHNYTGKEVRVAVMDCYRLVQQIRPLTRRQAKSLLGRGHLKNFKNINHSIYSVKPLPSMTVDLNDRNTFGMEFRLPNKHSPATVGPARFLLQETQPGYYAFRGVVAHDQSITNKSAVNYNDHYEVQEYKEWIWRACLHMLDFMRESGI